MLVRCPSCRVTFTTDRTGAQDCPSCGKPLVVPEPAEAVPADTQSSFPPGGEPPEAGTPWEQRDRLGFWRAWWDTVVQALFEPARMFRSARLDKGAAQLGFVLLTAGVPWFTGQLVERALLRRWMQKAVEGMGSMPMGPFMQRIFALGADTSPRSAALVALLTPLLVVVLLYLNVAVTHLAALLLGQAKRGFAATFAACAYACAPLLLLAIPGCGAPVAVVWTAVLTGVGLKETHRIGTGGAAAAVLAPWVLVCCASCALGILGGIAGRGIPQ